MTEIAERAGVPLPTVHREIDRLEQARLVTSRRVGSARLVTADADSPYYTELKSILHKAFGPLALLAELLEPIDGIEDAYLFGSWAARYRGEPGAAPADVDLLVIGEPDLDEIYDACREATHSLMREVQPTVVSSREWNDPDSGFLKTVQKRPLVRVPLRRAL